MLKHDLKPKILILGGTRDAIEIARKIEGDNHIVADITTSLAGRTKNPKHPTGHVITGGFGGVTGLVDYLKTQQIKIVIDATHPYAAQISRHAFTACKLIEIPLCRLNRPHWIAQKEDNWQAVNDINEAAKICPEQGKRILLTTGSNDITCFFNIPNIKIWARMIGLNEKIQLPENITPIFTRGPFDLEGECALICRHKIDLIITKNSGGKATVAKLIAARKLNIPVLMIKRPKLPDVYAQDSISGILSWVKSSL